MHSYRTVNVLVACNKCPKFNYCVPVNEFGNCIAIRAKLEKLQLRLTTSNNQAIFAVLHCFEAYNSYLAFDFNSLFAIIV